MTISMSRLGGLLVCTVGLLTGACASQQPDVPYPAFIVSDELPDAFIAGLPGVRAKQFTVNPRTGTSSNRVILPADWSFSTGAAPDKSVEMYILLGEIELGGLTLTAGGYAYIPPGSTGLQMRTEDGAVLLYFQDNADSRAVIQTPLITNSRLIEWQPLSDDPADFGFSVLELRSDPGSGAKTWLLRIDPVARQDWWQSSVVHEGYLLSGSHTYSECIDGEVATDIYAAGGYFNRPPQAIHGGPAAVSAGTSVWFMRIPENGTVTSVAACVADEAKDSD